MAIDYGKRRIGIALTDAQRVISQPLLTIKTTPEKELIKRLKFIIEENSVGLVLIGNPLSHQGTSTQMTHEIIAFVNKLKKAVDVEIKLMDERYTSKYAANVLKQIGSRKIKNKVDQVAASLMLDEYLRSQSEHQV
jgi:putative Holliday junction resolvase